MRTAIIMALILSTGLVSASFDQAWKDYKPSKTSECVFKERPWGNIMGIYGRNSSSGAMDICFVPGTKKVTTTNPTFRTEEKTVVYNNNPGEKPGVCTMTLVCKEKKVFITCNQRHCREPIYDYVRTCEVKCL